MLFAPSAGGAACSSLWHLGIVLGLTFMAVPEAEGIADALQQRQPAQSTCNSLVNVCLCRAALLTVSMLTQYCC